MPIAAFTISLHAFGLLLHLTYLKHNAAGVGFDTGEVRKLLDDSLETLRLIGRKSLMSQKARRCLLRFLDVFDSMSTYARGISHPSWTGSQQRVRLTQYFNSFR